MIYYIYKITFLCGEPKGRYYLGQHTHNPKYADTYTGSGYFCKRYFEKYGKIENVTYTKEILCYCSSKKELDEKEKEIIGNLYETDPLCMNMKRGGEGGSVKGHECSEETRKKIGEKNKISHKGLTPWNKDKKLSEEHISKLNLHLKNPTEETRKKMSESHIGNTPGNKGKFGVYHHSEETRKKMSKSRIGKRHSEETRKKMSESQKGLNTWTKGMHWKLVDGKRVYY